MFICSTLPVLSGSRNFVVCIREVTADRGTTTSGWVTEQGGGVAENDIGMV